MILPGNMRILVVDDNDYARAMANAMLSRIGIGDIVEADSGAGAIGMLLAEPFTAVLTDWYMPETNGAGLIRIVRSPSFGINKDIPILVMTAYATRENIGAARRLGIAEVLIKPLEQPLLAAALARAVSAFGHDTADAVFIGD